MSNLKRRFGAFKPASPDRDLIPSDDLYYMPEQPADRIVRQTSVFNRDLQCTIVTSHWQSGDVTTEYQYSEADGYTLTRVVPEPPTNSLEPSAP